MSKKNKNLEWAAFWGVGALVDAIAIGWSSSKHNEGEGELWIPLALTAGALLESWFTVDYLYKAGKEAAKEEMIALATEVEPKTAVIGDAEPPAADAV